MTVLYYGIKENNGGLENFAKNLIQAVHKKRKDIEYVLLVTCEDFSYRSIFESLGCKIIVLPNPRKNPLKFYFSLNAILKRYKDKIIQLNICSFRNYFLFKSCKKAKIKTIIVGHYTRIEGKLGFLHYMNQRKFKKLGLNITISDEVTNFMFVKDAKTILIDNGVPASEFSFSEESRKEIRKKLNLNNDCFVVGHIGRISSEKNQLFSIKVFEKLLESTNINTKLVLIGKVMDDLSIKYLASSKVKDKVILTGPVKENIEKYYSAFDVCLLPSIHEGMPLSLLECACNGVPSIMSNAVPKLKVDCPEMVHLDLDVDLWVNQIKNIKNKDKVNRKNVLQNTIYDMDECAKAYIKLYENYDLYLGKEN